MNPDIPTEEGTRRAGRRFGFTLLELLVSLTVLSLLLLLIFSMIDRTQEGWSAAEARVSQFREARNAFELVTRRVSQAVLNSYWDYERTGPTAPPTAYGRHSELHFVCGPIGQLLTASSSGLSTHGIFFQAPLGYTANKELRERNLDALLNECGYFIEYRRDLGTKPSFVVDFAPNRERLRLMEFRPPSEDMQIYEKLKDVYKKPSAGKQQLYSWFAAPVGEDAGREKKENSRPIAENIIALVFRPKQSELEAGVPTSIAPQYVYDTRLWQQSGPPIDPPTSVEAKTRNQLPPLVEITMVAVAERSMVRYQQVNGEAAPPWTDGLFLGSAADASFEGDLVKLEERLKADRIDYRIFNETVGIRASKWGED